MFFLLTVKRSDLDDPENIVIANETPEDWLADTIKVIKDRSIVLLYSREIDKKTYTRLKALVD